MEEGRKPPRFPKGSELSVKQVWHLEPGVGLPKRSFFTVFREGMDTDEEDPSGVYVGTGNGQLFFSRNAGGRRGLIADGLPPILSVNAASV
jgi:hypothetical protein